MNNDHMRTVPLKSCITPRGGGVHFHAATTTTTTMTTSMVCPKSQSIDSCDVGDSYRLTQHAASDIRRVNKHQIRGMSMRGRVLLLQVNFVLF